MSANRIQDVLVTLSLLEHEHLDHAAHIIDAPKAKAQFLAIAENLQEALVVVRDLSAQRSLLHGYLHNVIGQVQVGIAVTNVEHGNYHRCGFCRAHLGDNGEKPEPHLPGCLVPEVKELLVRCLKELP